ncbi:MAG: MBL fold metallo-hydrolase [Clostridia bacterium]|nr:MBL fold metallo-hydrolase [Clostridia bacterium]
MKIIQLRNFTPIQMMGFIIITDGGKVIVIDGGNKGDADGFLETLAGAAGGACHIDAWFMTHPHDDHYGVFKELTERALRGAQIPSCDGFYFCRQDNSLGEHEKHFAGQIVEFNEAVARTKYPLIELKRGDCFSFDTVRFEVLRVANPEIHENAFNNSSCVFRLTEDRGAKPPFVTIFLGDLGIEGGRELLAAYPEGSLRADALQLAHHGQNGVSREVYEAIAPRIALYCTPDWLWYNTIDPQKPGEGPWQTLEVRRWLEEIGAVPVRACLKNVILDTAFFD